MFVSLLSIRFTATFGLPEIDFAHNRREAVREWRAFIHGDEYRYRSRRTIREEKCAVRERAREKQRQAQYDYDDRF